MSIYPTLRYQDAHAAIDFLERAFGFERKALYDDGGVVQHAELRFGDGMVMLGSVKEGDFDRIAPPPGCASAYLVTGDVDALHERAVAAGADIVMPLRDLDYGSRDFAARDPEGNLWSFGTYDPRAT
jgi:uncharacterized glyoxalase superfamily protein PhnB